MATALSVDDALVRPRAGGLSPATVGRLCCSPETATPGAPPRHHVTPDRWLTAPGELLRGSSPEGFESTLRQTLAIAPLPVGAAAPAKPAVTLECRGSSWRLGRGGAPHDAETAQRRGLLKLVGQVLEQARGGSGRLSGQPRDQSV